MDQQFLLLSCVWGYNCNPIHKIKVETVGPPFKGNQVKIAEDGEILVKGENVMLGYWNKKEETDKVIVNGWLHTGDIGEIDPGLFLQCLLCEATH